MGTRLSGFTAVGSDSEIDFLVFPTVRRYARADWAALQTDVQTAREGMQLVGVSAIHQLLCDERGRRFGGYRWSHVAFRRLCAGLSPGLWALLASLLGWQRQGLGQACVSPDAASVALAVELLNSVIRLRGLRKLLGCRLLVNVPARTIEALVGPDYQSFSNADLLEKAGEFVRRQKPVLRPWAAYLVGHHLRIAYLGARPAFGVKIGDLDDAYRLGYFFVNADHGQAAVRAGNLLVRELDGGQACRAFPGRGSIAHSSQLQRQLPQLFRMTPDKFLLADTMRAFCSERQAELLPGGLRGQQSEIRRNELAVALERVRVRRNLSSIILQRVFHTGPGAMRDLTDTIVPQPKDETKTLYDLFTAVAFEASRRLLFDQDLLGHVAFRLLTGQLRL